MVGTVNEFSFLVLLSPIATGGIRGRAPQFVLNMYLKKILPTYPNLKT